MTVGERISMFVQHNNVIPNLFKTPGESVILWLDVEITIACIPVVHNVSVSIPAHIICYPLHLTNKVC